MLKMARVRLRLRVFIRMNVDRRMNRLFDLGFSGYGAGFVCKGLFLIVEKLLTLNYLLRSSTWLQLLLT